MNNRRIFVPSSEFKQIEQAIKNSGVKFYPFTKVNGGYEMEFIPQDNPLVVYLMLKYDGVRVQND